MESLFFPSTCHVGVFSCRLLKVAVVACLPSGCSYQPNTAIRYGTVCVLICVVYKKKQIKMCLKVLESKECSESTSQN